MIDRILSKEGFSLIEALVALVILEVGALGLLGLFGVIARGNDYARHHTEAMALAEDQLEAFRIQAALQGIDSLTSGADTNNPVDVTGEAGGEYTRTWSISTFNGEDDVKEATVVVQWNAGQSQIAATSLVSPNL